MGIRVGLTGGMGSGKSTVARFLTQRGAYLIDADAISRSTTSTGGAAIPELTQAFGPQVIDHDGALDRVKMRELAFQNPDARKRLEAIVHPLVKASIEQEALKQMQTRHLAWCTTSHCSWSPVIGAKASTRLL